MKSGRSDTSSSVERCGSTSCRGEDCFLASLDRTVAIGACRLDPGLRVVCAHGALTQRLPRTAEDYIGKLVREMDDSFLPEGKKIERRLLDVLAEQKRCSSR